MPIEKFRFLPIAKIRQAVLKFASDPANDELVERAFRVRAVETALLSLFGKGKVHGTIHTCVGQELVGVLTGNWLSSHDFVTSNHRGHGHFIGLTKNWQGLIDEIVGNQHGVCAGVGGSQHLCEGNFLSNGQQGGLVPVAAGIALDRKRRGNQGIVVTYIGEGTLGEGIVYETMNIAALWRLPLLIICENNYHSQSTPQAHNLAGNICERAAAFGLETYRTNTWFPYNLSGVIETATQRLRNGGPPSFVQVETYRLNPHSKGDDHRDPAELSDFVARDPLNLLLMERRYLEQYNDILEHTRLYAEKALSKPKLDFEKYTSSRALSNVQRHTRSIKKAAAPDEYFARSINRYYADLMAEDAAYIFFGEDIADPYGGAFKITMGLEAKCPGRVIPTPISEAAIVGVGIGMAINGNKPIVEIMFGDFMTFTVDQIVNNAAKIRLMYNRRLECPLIIRAPMGGGRGYGPTHSQSLEKHFIGIPDTIVLSLNTLADVDVQLRALPNVFQPVIIVENKSDYARKIFRCPPSYNLKIDDEPFPAIILTPLKAKPTLTIVSYGGTARLIADNLIEIFFQTEFIPELIVLSAIYPLKIEPILASVEQTGRLVTIEEGVSFAGVGAEIVAQVSQQSARAPSSMTIGSMPFPIPAEPTLEALILPNIKSICTRLMAFRAGEC